MWGLSRTLVNNMVDGRHQGLRADARAGRRRLPRGDEGPGALHAARLLPRRGHPAAGRHHLRRAEADRDQASPASTSSWSAKSPPASAVSVRRSPTRARACATPARRSAARKARRSKPWRSPLATPPSAAPSAPAPACKLAQRPSAPVGVPLGEEHLRPGHRRCARRDPGRRLDAGRRQEGQAKGADKDAAARVGTLVAERAIEKGVKDVVFDRGGYLYHGRVKALADAAREAGLNF